MTTMAINDQIMNALPMPVLTVGQEHRIVHANAAPRC
jgi:two-component system nitrogen regulation sensor histidine kinase GlnL